MKTTRRLTWSAPDGSWGVHGVELETLPTKIYTALNKLMEMESTVERLNNPATEDFEAEVLMQDLLSMAPWEPDPAAVQFFDGRRYVSC